MAFLYLMVKEPELGGSAGKRSGETGTRGSMLALQRLPLAWDLPG